MMIDLKQNVLRAKAKISRNNRGAHKMRAYRIFTPKPYDTYANMSYEMLNTTIENLLQYRHRMTRPQSREIHFLSFLSLDKSTFTSSLSSSEAAKKSSSLNPNIDAINTLGNTLILVLYSFTVPL